MGILEDALSGAITEEMKTVAEDQGRPPEFISRGIASGRIVIPVSPYRYTKPVGDRRGAKD